MKIRGPFFYFKLTLTAAASTASLVYILNGGKAPIVEIVERIHKQTSQEVDQSSRIPNANFVAPPEFRISSQSTARPLSGVIPERSADDRMRETSSLKKGDLSEASANLRTPSSSAGSTGTAAGIRKGGPKFSPATPNSTPTENSSPSTSPSFAGVSTGSSGAPKSTVSGGAGFGLSDISTATPAIVLPPEASALSLSSPATSPNSVSTPIIAVTVTAKAGQIVKLYTASTNADCTAGNLVGQSTGNGATINVTSSALVDGTYIFRAITEDTDGNVSSCSTANVTYTLNSSLPAAPAIAFNTPASSPSNNATPMFTISLEGGGNFSATDTITLYNQAACAGSSVGTATGVTTATVAITASAQTEGTSVIYSAKVTDIAGNFSCSSAHTIAGSRSKTYRYDGTAPVVPLIVMASGSPNPDTDSTPTFAITLTGAINYTDADLITLYEGGNNTCNGTARGTSTISGSGTASVNITTNSALSSFGAVNYFAKVTDAAGNSTCTSTAIAYTYRPLPPSTLTRLTPSGTPGNNVTPTITVSGGGVVNGATIDLYSDSSCSTAVSADTASTGTSVDVTATTLTAGAYLFYATVTINNVASACSTAAVAYLLDLTPPAIPAIAFYLPAASPGTSSTPSFEISLTGGGNFASTDSITLYNQAACAGSSVGTKTNVSTATTTLAASAQIEDTITYSVKVTDEAGNSICSSSHATVGSRSKAYLYDNTAPTWSNSLSNAATYLSLTDSPVVTFTADADDGATGSGISKYQYAVGTSSGGTQKKAWTDLVGGSSPSTTIQATGLTLTSGTTYYFSMRAVDGVSLSSTVYSSSWVAQAVPILSYSGSTGTTINFGSAMSVTPTTLNTNGSTISACVSSPALPGGLSLNSSTCVISGTPAAAQAATAYTITATSAFGDSSGASVTLTVNAQVPTISYSGATGTAGAWGTAMSVTPTTLNGRGASITSCSSSPGLPAWATLDATTCVITGTPNATLSSTSYTITATNSVGSSTGATVNLSVAAAAPTLSYSGATGTSAYSYSAMSVTPTTLTANGAAITACTSSPTLPTGVSIDNTTCVISGTPTVAQAATPYTISAVNASGTTTASVSLTVTDPIYITAPLNLTAAEGNGSVVLNWIAANSSPNSFTYIVKRGTASGSYSTLASNISSGTLTYTDSTATNGTTYYYVVVADNTSVTATSNEVAATPSTCAAAPVIYTSTQDITVPAGCNYLHAKAWGGAGGAGGVSYTGAGLGAAGGFSAATFAVTPAETISIYVATGGSVGIDGGYSGGGAGGGSSALKRISPLTTLLEASGGGGGGGGGSYGLGGAGGAGGGASGVSGLPGSSGYNESAGGAGGTSSAGGAGGIGVSHAGGSSTDANGGSGGTSVGTFSVAGTGFASGGTGGGPNWAGGGGGGAGHYGGGGGGDGYAASGGGGGSSYADPGALNSVLSAGSGRIPASISSGYYANDAGFAPGPHLTGNPGLVVLLWSASNTAAPAPLSVSVPASGPLTSSPQISWVYSSTGTSLAVDHFEVALGTSPGGTDVAGWEDAGLAKSYFFSNLTLSNGSSYYASVRSVDVAGNNSAATSSAAWTASSGSCASPAVYATAGTYVLSIPAGCSSVVIKAWGGGGGGAGSYSGYLTGGAGGGGAYSSAVLNVVPTEILTIKVAGGGAGGAANACGGGGGGASAVLRGTTPVVVAAGGGGGVDASNNAALSLAGGAGGALYGEIGNGGGHTSAPSAGTQLSVGKGGSGDVYTSQPGANGSGANGGDGGDGNVAQVASGGSGYGTGGKGGGGFYGGGGGGGGYYGGGGGSRGGYDGTSGSGGSSYSTGGSRALVAGIGATPGKNTDPAYTGSAGTGGVGGNAGSSYVGVSGKPGLVVITYGP